MRRAMSSRRTIFVNERKNPLHAYNGRCPVVIAISKFMYMIQLQHGHRHRANTKQIWIREDF